jgi:hypothetical protein
MIKIGVTGTRKGATDEQLTKVVFFLEQFLGQEVELHHGDCIGVDVEVAAIAETFGYKIICHPPTNGDLRGFFEGNEVRQEKGYLTRNRNIVDETDMLIVVPVEDSHQTTGGTWYTHDYAVKKGKAVYVFYPTQCKEDIANLS